jgi:SPP1 gp7 family putative phage head morphogenesis protein
MREAAAYLARRVGMTAEAFYALDAAARLRAFTVSRVACSDALAAVREALTDALQEGAAPGEAARAAQDALRAFGADPLSPHHLDLVVRNNTAAAYSVGRHAQFEALGDDLEALAFVGIADRRQSDVCRAYNGLTAPAGDPVWDTVTPPNHHACRSTVRALLRGTSFSLTPLPERRALPRPPDGWDASARSAADLAALPLPVLSRAADYGIPLP